jgi:chaperonin GroES
MSNRIQPLGDRVVLKELEIKEEKIGSIYVPDTAKEKPLEAEIVAVGDADEIKGKVAVGDKVIYAKYSGTEVKMGGETFIIIGVDDLLAKVI